MNLFDKSEDKFLKKIDVLYNISQENKVSFELFAERIDKIVMGSSEAQGNAQYAAYVKERLRAYKKMAKESKLETS